MRKRVDVVPALLAMLLGLSCVTGSLLARPHLLALPLLAVWTLGLVRRARQNRAPCWWLIAVMPLWANLHGSFAFGLALAAALGVEAVMTAERMKAIHRLGHFRRRHHVITLLNPQIWHRLLFPLHMSACRVSVISANGRPAISPNSRPSHRVAGG